MSEKFTHPAPNAPQLSRTLGLLPTTTIVIGSVVGSGIFVSSGGMARDLGSAPMLIFVWVLGGVLTYFGALTQCELVGQMPRTGGLYEYLKEIYGEPIGFLYGWANFAIAGSGSIAALAFIFANHVGWFVPLPHLSADWEKVTLHLPYVGNLFPFADLGTKAVGAALVCCLTALNIRGVKLGATVQVVSTLSKLAAILAIVMVAFIWGSKVGSFANLSSVTPKGAALNYWTLVGAIGMALSGAFWAYDGWGNVAYIAGEVKDPSRTIPRAMLLGTLSFVGLYVLVNLAYLYILPIGAMGEVAGDRIAARVVSAVIGTAGGSVVAALILLSTFDTTNSSVLTNARVYYAMATHGIFWQRAANIHPTFRTPHFALLSQGLWSIFLLMSGSFELIASMYVFVNWVLYVLMALGVFILRSRNPLAVRPFTIPGYPWVPAIFTLFSLGYLAVTLIMDVQAFRAGEQPMVNSVMGLLLVFSGLPFYFLCRNKKV